MRLKASEVRKLLGERAPSKYRARPHVVDGIRFASSLEARRYQELGQLQKAGVVLWFIRQPSFDLGAGVRYVADFLVVYAGMLQRISVEDCKGFKTPVFKVKEKLFRERYPAVQLRLVTAADLGRGRHDRSA